MNNLNFYLGPFCNNKIESTFDHEEDFTYPTTATTTSTTSTTTTSSLIISCPMSFRNLCLNGGECQLGLFEFKFLSLKFTYLKKIFNFLLNFKLVELQLTFVDVQKCLLDHFAIFMLIRLFLN